VILRFVEPYRDRFGIRAEFEGVVAIADKDETKILTGLIQNADKFIKRLPWRKTQWIIMARDRLKRSSLGT
jgi:dipeptidyl-peptidase-3